MSFFHRFLFSQQNVFRIEPTQNINHFWLKFFKRKQISLLKEPFLTINDSLCTMGSCFANELRNSLTKRGLDVFPRLPAEHLSLFSKFSFEIPDWGVWDERVHFQWYNPASLLLEAKIAFLGSDDSLTRSVFPCKKKGQIAFQDPHRRLVFADSESQLLQLRARMDESISKAFHNAKAFVFTLGLTETWWDKSNGLPLCADPDYGNPDSKSCCYFENMDYQKTFESIDLLIRLINLHRGDQVPIFVSVSPIPLARTFRNLDVVIANTESKCTLRTAAAKISQIYKNVIYFPSFEICQLDSGAFCERDGRHVKREKVDAIIDSFFKCFVVQ